MNINLFDISGILAHLLAHYTFSVACLFLLVLQYQNREEISSYEKQGGYNKK